MYGLVNKAIEGLVTQAHGEDAWEAVIERAGVEDSVFIGMDPYEDEVTYNLVAAAAEVLNADATDLLVAFGEYWTTYVVEEGYEHLLELDEGGIVEFLRGLDDMHARVNLAFPELAPPSFRTEVLGEREVDLHYYSDRPGLAPMVIGLVRGLGKRFNVTPTVEHTVERSDTEDHDVFRVAW